ncbi:type II CAAX prenyl endopeptidase Rce1 family protein [Paenibacillus tepidiphilus]|uniref:CPBP family glutamic-type intramembrane protease n=1 Tax=Paenibacillus tepidiphilus TaxID=2608683 RepID=UPI00123AE2B0|nr:CPBP family glutamic-type intramembrane protease [Paenibacillus tepidiphilus]
MIPLARNQSAGRSHRGAIAILGWLSMTLGLFAASAIGQWVRTAGGTEESVRILQALVTGSTIVPVVYLTQLRFGVRLNLLPVSTGSLVHLLCGFGLPLAMTGAGFLIAASKDWITITGWHWTPELISAVLMNLFIALLYEALPEELTLRGLVYSGLRLRLPAVLAYFGQMILFVLVPLTVLFLQKLTGMPAGNTFTADYVILLLGFGLTLQLWRSLTGSLWASVGFHLAYLTLSRFVVLPRGYAALTYTEQEAGTGGLFILFGMTVLGSAGVLIVLLLGTRLLLGRRGKEAD